MREEEFGVITFKSTHHAIQGEKKMASKDIDFRTIPTPREVSTSCGLAIRFKLEDLDRVREAIETTEMEIDSTYKIVKSKEGNYSENL